MENVQVFRTSLDESNELLRLFICNSPFYTYIREVTHTESRMLFASNNFYKMVGFEVSEVIVGKTMTELFPFELANRILVEDLAVVATNAMLEVEEEFDGHVYSIVKFPITLGKKTLVAGYAVDITVHKQVEKERLKAQKLESLGVLAGGIAHDFNNLLTAIMGNLSLAYLEVSRDKLEKLLDEVMEASKRASQLTRKLLTFAKGGIPETTLGSIAEVVRSSAEFSLGRNSNCRSKIILPSDLRLAIMDSGQIAQVIQNLVINAKQAMTTGGDIVVKAENVDLVSNNTHGLSEGPYVHISVQDTGVGIPEENIEKIFEPYFSTKSGNVEEEGGSGLGLAVVYSVIKNHKGKITVESKRGRGTIFHILLPAVEHETSTTPVEEKKAGNSRNLKILVMDDEQVIRNLLGRMLERLGHTAEYAESGREVLQKYDLAMKFGEPFHMVILDLTIPGGMGGVETLKELQKIDENVVAVVSSGYSSSVAGSFHGVLPKPYTLANLRKMIESVFQS